ncbi:hypothetical protein Tco_1504760 [Tanacetum coccineum]
MLGETSNFSHESIEHCEWKELSYESLSHFFRSSDNTRTQSVEPNLYISRKRRWKKFELDGVHIGIAISEHSINLNEFGDVLVWIGPRMAVKLSVFDHLKAMTFHGEVVSKVNWKGY